jgi:peptidoglycan pentaglycine glycine transferase (the first glycine)
VTSVVFREAEADDRESWDRFVATRPEGDPLQAWAWGDATPLGGEQPRRYLLQVHPDGPLRALAQVLTRPSRVNRPIWYVPHGPLWERDAPDADQLLTSLLHGTADAARAEGAIVMKVDPRGDERQPPDAIAASLLARTGIGSGVRRARYDLQATTTRIVDLLDGGERLVATWDADARRLSRRAESEGVAVEIDRTGSSGPIGEFHALLEATAERGDFRARSQAFLERAASSFVAPDGPGRSATGWYTVLARDGGRAIAGMALPRVGDRAYYFYGASLKDPALKNKNASYAAMTAAMRELATDGVRTLDMWGVAERGDPAAAPSWEGFSVFKRKFGGRPLRHPGTFDLVLDPRWYFLRDVRERLRDRFRR